MVQAMGQCEAFIKKVQFIVGQLHLLGRGQLIHTAGPFEHSAQQLVGPCNSLVAVCFFLYWPMPANSGNATAHEIGQCKASIQELTGWAHAKSLHKFMVW